MLDNIDEYNLSDQAYNGPSISQVISHPTGPMNAHGGGFFSQLLDFIGTDIMPVALAAAAVYAGATTAAGLFGEAAVAGAGAGDAALGAGLGDLSAAGLGSLPIDYAALGTGAADFAGLGGGLEAASAGASGLGAIAAGGSGVPAAAGSMIGVEGGAPAVVSVGAPAAAGGSLIPPALGAGLGAGAILGSNPTQPINTAPLQQLPDVNTTPNSNVGVEGGPPAVVSVGPPTPVPQGSLPPVVVPPMDYNPVGDQTNPIIPYLPPGSVTPGGGTPSGGTPSTGGIPDWLKGLIPLLGGNVDRIKAQQDADWWKSQLDTLQGMYKPGTPEATLMEDKMSAMDAATGRNSQYGVRAVNLASSLADKRANIMTSPGYQNMANAYRGRSSQDLNGLFSALGNSGTQNLLGSLGGTISNLFSNP